MDRCKISRCTLGCNELEAGADLQTAVAAAALPSARAAAPREEGAQSPAMAEAQNQKAALMTVVCPAEGGLV